MPDFAELGFKIDKTPVDQAATSLDRLTASATKAESASKRLTSGMSAAGQAAAQAGAGQRAWETGLARMAQQQQVLVTQTDRAHQSFGRFQNAIANLGLTAVGVQGPMQKVVETIAILGIGSAVATGVLAGIAAIAYAIRLAKVDTDAWTKALEDQRKVVSDMIDKWAEMGKAAQAATLLGLKTQQTQAQQRINFLSALAITNPEVVPKLIDANIALISINKAIADLDRELNNIPKAPFIDWAEGVAEAIRNIDFAIDEVLTNGARLGRNLGAMGLSGGEANQAALVNAANAGGFFIRGTEGAARSSRELATNWQSVASSVANTVTLLANADTATSRWLGNMVNLVGLIADANAELKDAGKLSTGSTIGLIAGGLSFLAGALGDNEATRRANELAEKNHDAVERLIRSLDNISAGLTGNQIGTARGGVNALLGAIRSNPTDFIRGIGLNTGAANAVLRGQGTTLNELRSLASDLGLTLDTTNVIRFRDSLAELQKALQEMDLVRLESFGSQLDLINRQWALGNVTDPLAKIADLLKLITGEQGSPGLATLGNFDLSSGGGRNAALTFLQNQLLKAQNGGLTTAELGGLTVQQYLDFLSQFGALLNEANQALQATVDNLQSFADSLKLDQSLTTLSPGQQLAEARRQYEDVLRAAQAGDLNAANRLPDVARQFLSASRAYNASSPAYAADFARVLADTEAVQKLLQGQEDGWRAVEKPLVNVVDNTQSTVERLETLIEVQRVGLQETVDKLDAIRSELVAQVLATKIGFEGGKV